MNGVPEAQSENIKFWMLLQGDSGADSQIWLCRTFKNNEIPPGTAKWKNDSFREHGA